MWNVNLCRSCDSLCFCAFLHKQQALRAAAEPKAAACGGALEGERQLPAAAEADLSDLTAHQVECGESVRHRAAV